MAGGTLIRDTGGREGAGAGEMFSADKVPILGEGMYQEAQGHQE